MSTAGHVLAVAGIAASALAALILWLAARRRSGRCRLAYLWFGGAAGFWCLGVIAQQVLGAPLSGVAVGLTFADLPPLLALIAVVAGVVALVAAGGGKAGDGWRILGQRMARRPEIPRLADGFVLAAVLFVIGWITLLGPDYIRSGSGPGAFAVELLHPLADLVAAALVLPMISAAGVAAVPPFVAVLLVTGSDALGVSARLNGGTPGAPQQAVALAAFCVLGLTPWLAGPRAARRGRMAAEVPAAAVTSGAAALAAVAVCVWALARGHGAPALVVVASAAVLALAARMLGAVVGGRRPVRTSLESGRRFRELAHLTSDAVIVCERGGVIRYASPAVAEYGYSTDRLLGTRLDELVHPEDRPGCRQAVVASLAQPGLPGRFPWRVL